MNRRFLLAATAWFALGLVACSAAPPVQAQPVYKVSTEQLQRALEQRFPRRHTVSGVLELELDVPRLRLLPEQNRVGSELTIHADGPALRRRYSGSIDLDFALRYEPGDQSIRAHHIRVNAVRVGGLSRDASRLLDAYARAYAEQALAEVVLHRLRPQDLALPNAMGLEPGSITVTAEGLAIAFVPQTR